MGFFSSLWGKNSEDGKNTQNNTPTVQQPRMTEAQRHDAFVQSLRENTANGKYGPVPTQSTARKAAAGSSEDGGRERGDDPGAPGSQGRESGLKFGTSNRMGTSRARRTSWAITSSRWRSMPEPMQQKRPSACRG